MKYLLLLPALLLFSCADTTPIDNFKGGIIVDKGDIRSLSIKYKAVDSLYYYKDINVKPFDFDSYAIGDTIK